MFDTNIFNKIVEGTISLTAVRDISSRVKLFVTHIQRYELNATKNEERRKGLLKVFEVINQVQVPTESALWDVSNWDSSKWDKQAIDTILELLEKEKPHNRGNKRDALIGLTAIKTGITLVSNDEALRDSVNELGGIAIDLLDFLKETESKT